MERDNNFVAPSSGHGPTTKPSSVYLVPCDLFVGNTRSLIDYAHNALDALSRQGCVPCPRYGEMTPWLTRISKSQYSRVKETRLHAVKLLLHIDGYLNSVENPKLVLDFSAFGQCGAKEGACLSLLRQSIRALVGVNPPRFRYRYQEPESVEEKVLNANLELNRILSHDPKHEGHDYIPKNVNVFEFLSETEATLEDRRLVTRYESNQVRKKLGYREKIPIVTHSEFNSVRHRVFRSQYISDRISHGIVPQLLDWRKRQYPLYVKGQAVHPTPYELLVRLDRYMRVLSDLSYYERRINEYIDYFAPGSPEAIGYICSRSPRLEREDRQPLELSGVDFSNLHKRRIQNLRKRGPLNPSLPDLEEIRILIDNNEDLVRIIRATAEAYNENLGEDRINEIRSSGPSVQREISNRMLEMVDTTKSVYISSSSLRKHLKRIGVIMRQEKKSWSQAERDILWAMSDAMRPDIRLEQRIEVLKLYLEEARLRCLALNENISCSIEQFVQGQEN